MPHPLSRATLRGGRGILYATVVYSGLVPCSWGQDGTEVSGNNSSEALISEKDALALDSDGSVADSLKRRTDLAFDNIRVDGEETTLDLDDISAQSVHSAEVLKAVLPDMDADARGGSLSIRSRPNFSLAKPDLKLRLDLKYHDIFEEFEVDTAGSYAFAFGPQRQFGMSFGFVTDRWLWGVENTNRNWRPYTVEGEEVYLPDRFDYGELKEARDDYQVDASFDFRLSDRFYLFARGSAGHFDGLQTTHNLQYRFFPQDGFDPANIDGALIRFPGAQIDKRFIGYEMELDRVEWTGGGFYDGDLWNFDFRYRVARTWYEEPDFFVIDFIQPGVELLYDGTNLTFPRVDLLEGEPLEQPVAFVFDDLNSEHWTNTNEQQSAFANLRRSFERGNGSGFLKTGYKWREKSLDRFSGTRIFDQFDGTFTLQDAVSPWSKSGILDHYSLDTFPGLKQARAFFQKNFDDFTLNERRTRENADQGTFFVEETLHAAYVMASYEWAAFRILGGFRYEETTIDYIGQEVIISGAGEYLETNQLTGNRTYGNSFPSIYFRSRLTPRITFITSLTYTIKRPDFGQVVPSRNVNLENRILDEGNPDLDPTLFTNYDASIEFKVNGSGLVTLEGFYKEVEDLVFPSETKIESGPYAGFDRIRLQNSGSGTTQGILLTWDQGLDAIPLLPDGFGFNLQYRYEDAEVTYPFRPGERLPFTATPEQILDLTVRYKGEAFYAHLKMSYEEEMYNRVGRSPEEDRYRLDRTVLNLNANYRITPNLTLDLEYNNILGTPNNDLYDGVPERRVVYGTSGWNAQLGLRWQM